MKFHRIGSGKNFQRIREGKKVLGEKGICRNWNPEKISAPKKSTLLYPPTFDAPLISSSRSSSPRQVREGETVCCKGW